MKRVRAVCGGAALAVLVTLIQPLSGAAEVNLVLKSASSTSSYYVMMVQLAELIRTASGGAIDPTVEESQGSVQNVAEAPRRAGGFVFTTPPSVLERARAGGAPFEGGTGFDRVRTLFVMPFVTIHLVVAGDSDITDVTDLAGQRFIAGGTDTFCEKRVQAIFQLLGIGDRVDYVAAAFNDAPDALGDGRVAGYATCSAHPVPGLQELATTTDVRILSFTEEQRANLITADPLSGPVVIAADTYTGQDEAVATVGVPVGAYTTTDMDERTAYLIVSSFWQNHERLAANNPWWVGVTPDLLEHLRGTPLHPGALRYYEEAGIPVPDQMK